MLKYFALIILILASFSAVSAYDVYYKSSRGYIWENQTYDNRTLIDWDLIVHNTTDCPTCSIDDTYWFDNNERFEYYIALQIIPAPNDDCFHNNENCDATYDKSVNISSQKWGYYGLFPTLIVKEDIKVVDMTGCWNWWNETDENLQYSRQRNCPVVVYKIEEKDQELELTFQKTSTVALPYPNYYARFLGFSENRQNADTLLSSPIYSFITTLVGFEDIILDVWRIFYYTAAVVLVVYDIVMVIGVLPLGLRWVVKKLTGD
jgi:hypothetical protein